MENLPDPPRGWLELRARMSRAKTPEEINKILEEMHRALDAYEAKGDSRIRSQASRQHCRDSKRARTNEL